MNREKVALILSKDIDRNFDSKTEAADRFKITLTHLGRLTSGNHEIPHNICEYLGIDRFVEYKKKGKK